MARYVIWSLSHFSGGCLPLEVKYWTRWGNLLRRFALGASDTNSTIFFIFFFLVCMISFTGLHDDFLLEDNFRPFPSVKKMFYNNIVQCPLKKLCQGFYLFFPGCSLSYKLYIFGMVVFSLVILIGNLETYIQHIFNELSMKA